MYWSHARNDFQPNTCGIRRVLCDGARLTEIVPKKNPVRFLTVANNGTLCYGYDGEISQ